MVSRSNLRGQIGALSLWPWVILGTVVRSGGESHSSLLYGGVALVLSASAICVELRLICEKRRALASVGTLT